MPIVNPGFVQNCPTPSVTEFLSPSAMASARSASAPGSRKTGFTLPISAYTGIGSGRLAAASNSAHPARRLPVKATALIWERWTSVLAISFRVLWINEKVPGGIPAALIASMTAPAASSDVAGCAGCAFTTTGHPAASADAVSPPATENANGKLLAANTATGPMGISMRRMSGFGSGLRSGRARSMRAFTHEPSRIWFANIRNWPAVRPRSAARRSGGSAVSAFAASNR